MYAGQSWYDPNAMKGVQSASRNPKRKKRLPRHAKRHLSLPVMAGNEKCPHSLSQHEQVRGGRFHNQTISYALPCQVGHKATTKNPVHKDATGRKW